MRLRARICSPAIPTACCALRKVAPLKKTLSGYNAWVTGIRRVEAPTRANAPLISFDDAFGLVKINPIAAVVRRRHAGLHRRALDSRQSACRRGLSVHRLRSVHQQASPRQRSAQRPLGRSRQDRMRVARIMTVDIDTPSTILSCDWHTSSTLSTPSSPKRSTSSVRSRASSNAR